MIDFDPFTKIACPKSNKLANLATLSPNITWVSSTAFHFWLTLTREDFFSFPIIQMQSPPYNGSPSIEGTVQLICPMQLDAMTSV